MISILDNGSIVIDGEESNFIIQEFVPKTIYQKYGNKSVWFVREQTFRLAQFYRDWWKVPVYVNNWHNGGATNLRGFREPSVGIVKHLKEELDGNDLQQLKQILLNVSNLDNEKLSIGSWLSQHKQGNAFDCDVKGLSANEVRREILDNKEEFIAAGVTTLESARFAPSWVHTDCRITANPNDILIVGA